MAGAARETLLERVTTIAERAARREGIEVWEIELLGSGRSRVLRIFIDKPGGVTHADCELISQQVGTVLDVEDVMPGDSYHLEVSSPGVERKLRNTKDFERFRGEKVKVALREAMDGFRRFEARIDQVEPDGTLVFDAGPRGAIRLRMEQIDKANLKFEW